jgi:hypothetical protein
MHLTFWQFWLGLIGIALVTLVFDINIKAVSAYFKKSWSTDSGFTDSLTTAGMTAIKLYGILFFWGIGFLALSGIQGRTPTLIYVSVLVVVALLFRLPLWLHDRREKRISANE